MSNPFGPLPVVQKRKAGDTIEVTEKRLRDLRSSDVYDSYSNAYRFDGLVWRAIAQMSREDGETVVILQAEGE